MEPVRLSCGDGAAILKLINHLVGLHLREESQGQARHGQRKVSVVMSEDQVDKDIPVVS